MAIIKDNRDLDTTIVTLFGSILAVLIVGGLFWLHAKGAGNDGFLSAEMVMSIIQLPATFIAYSLGKKSGQTDQSQANASNKGE